uniref:Calmodulin n=1 Tax=Compsopogon caeruleus TaxID=31354 RepID=A0A7S1XET4_9RHOD
MCSGGELFDRILSKGHYSEKDAAEALRTMLQILNHCHSIGVIHRDLKPENYLLDGPSETSSLKLTDFGLSTLMPKDSMCTEIVGTPVYIAPEVLKAKYNEKADIWSCGCILYILLSGKLPFYGDNEREELRATLAGKYDLEKHPWPTISDGAKDVVRQMLTMDPAMRPSAAMLLEHRWVRVDGTANSNPLADSVLIGLKDFQKMNKLKKRVIQFMANNIIREDLGRMSEIFKTIDTDNSGSITIDELKEAIKKTGTKIPEAELQEIVDTYDVDGDGTIDYSEFLLATSNMNKLNTIENIDHAFRLFDKDGNGSITPAEVLEALKDCGVSMQNVLDMIKEADKDGDGMIQYEEFVEMMKDLDEMKNVTNEIKRLNLSSLL